MRRRRALLASAAGACLSAGLPAVPAGADTVVERCHELVCTANLTPEQMLAEAGAMVQAGRYAEARSLLVALAPVARGRLEWRFLAGYVAQQTGDLRGAAAIYRDILTSDPGQTRVRLELARVMMMQGKMGSADRMFRLAQSDADLPPEIARTIRAARDVIRSRRTWSLDVDVGLAPDSNINNATANDTVNVLFGSQAVPLTLNADARARSGVGRTGLVDAGLRLPVGGSTLMLLDATASGSDYRGTQYDDFAYEAAAGPEFRLSPTMRLRFEGVGAERVYGGRIATRQVGIKAGWEAQIGFRSRLGVQIDARHTDARFDSGYSGWQLAATATYERAVARNVIASAGLFARTDRLAAAPYSNVELGGIAGIGGSLPMGFELGVSGTVSRATYDAPITFFSLDSRRDWRLGARATLGNRALRWQGFSPTVSVSWNDIDSSLGYYATRRTRFRFGVARYF